jgi:hypothetical protein
LTRDIVEQSNAHQQDEQRDADSSKKTEPIYRQLSGGCLFSQRSTFHLVSFREVRQP